MISYTLFLNLETEISAPTIAIGAQIDALSVQQEKSEQEPVVTEPIEDKEKIVEVSDTVNLEQCLEAVKNVEATTGKTLDDINQRVVVLETEIGHLLEKVNSIQEGEKIGEGNIDKLIAKVEEIEMDIEKIGQAMDKLFDDKGKQETDINVRTFSNKIKLIKVIVYC